MLDSNSDRRPFLCHLFGHIHGYQDVHRVSASRLVASFLAGLYRTEVRGRDNLLSYSADKLVCRSSNRSNFIIPVAGKIHCHFQSMG